MYDRREANLQILEALRDLVVRHPDQRFVQLLINSGVLLSVQNDPNFPPQIANEWHTEPTVTLDRLMKSRIWSV